MRLLAVGAGSTGGYFGGRLAQAGRDVTFLVRERRAAELRANGLQVISPHGSFNLAPKLVTAGKIDAPFDAVLLSVKAYSLDAALDDLAPAIGPGSVILPVLNGMKHVETLSSRFGRHAVAGCVCRIAACLDDQGRVVQLAKFHDLAYGELDGSSTPRMARLDAFMQNAGFDAKLSPVIAREMWEKWMMLATLGGVTCLMRGNVGEIVAVSGGSEFINRFLDEVVAVVSAAGIAPSEGAVAGARALLTAQGSTFTSSMFRDLQNGGPIEATQIIGDLVSRARQANIAAPLLTLADTHLSVYQHKQAAQK